MPRDLTTTMAGQIDARRLAPVLFVEAQFVSGWARMWSGYGSINWNGQTWLGLALPNGEMLGAISKLTETTDLAAQAVSLSLSSIPATAVQQVLNECRPNFPVNIYLGAADLDTGAILPDPYRAWGGTMDVPVINDQGDTCTATISVESRLVDLNRPREWRYTHEDQQVLHPGDLGFEFVGALQNISITWGTGSPVAPGGVVTSRKG